MREIKFRGKRIDNGEWAFGCLYYWMRYNKKIPIIGDGVRNGSVQGFEVDPETVGQFIGLTDKNGKEIYEGDILYRRGHFGVMVIFDRGMRVMDTDPVRFVNKCTYTYIHDFNFYERKITGNIHDNPELLK